MDILNIQALIKEGKIVSQSDVNPNETYLQVGVFQPGNRKSGASNPNAYASYAISVSDIAPPVPPSTIGVYGLNTLYTNTITGEVGARSIALGTSTGYLTLTSPKSVFLGESAGYKASNSPNSIFIGELSGLFSQFSSNTIAMGKNAAYYGTYSANCIFIGEEAGLRTSYNTSFTNTRNHVIALGYRAGKDNTKGGQFIISNSSMPVYAGLAAATTALTGGSSGSTYLWIDSTDNNIVKAFIIP